MSARHFRWMADKLCSGQGWDRDRLAKELGISRRTLFYYLSGGRKPPFAVLNLVRNLGNSFGCFGGHLNEDGTMILVGNPKKPAAPARSRPLKVLFGESEQTRPVLVSRLVSPLSSQTSRHRRAPELTKGLVFPDWYCHKC